MKNVKYSLVLIVLLPALGILSSPMPGWAGTTYRPFIVCARSPLLDERGDLLLGENPYRPDWNGQSGDLVQVLLVGPDGVISSPDLSGNPTGDDAVLTVTHIGEGEPHSWVLSGRFCFLVGRPPDENIYARVFNASTPEEAFFYGDSTIFTVARAKDENFAVDQNSLPATDRPLDGGDDDGDGANNSWEKSLQTNKDLYDTDGDGLLDGEELLGHTLPVNRHNLGLPAIGNITFNVADPGIPVTNPKSIDTDEDTYSDYDEVVNLLSDPTDPGDPPPPTPTPTPRVPTPPPTTPTPAPTAVIPTPTAGIPTPTPSPRPTAFYQVMGESDFDGDGTADIAIFRDGFWAVRGLTQIYFGTAGDRPASGDYNGDGTVEAAIFRTGLWAIRGVNRLYYGQAGDLAVPADYDGDGVCDIAVYRPSSGLWSVHGGDRLYFGASGDIPIPADFDGDGTADPAIYRQGPGLWAVRGVTRLYFGRFGDRVVPVDYDGDDTADIGIFRQDTGLWVFRGVTRSYFGGNLDHPVSADYSGSGFSRIGIFRPSSGLWSIRGLTRVYFGTSGDIPVAR